jgi:hypothetical protein
LKHFENTRIENLFVSDDGQTLGAYNLHQHACFKHFRKDVHQMCSVSAAVLA